VVCGSGPFDLLQFFNSVDDTKVNDNHSRITNNDSSRVSAGNCAVVEDPRQSKAMCCACPKFLLRSLNMTIETARSIFMWWSIKNSLVSGEFAPETLVLALADN
jgi:hypothetical protein